MSSRAGVYCLLALGCSAESVAPRAQTLLFVDTNAPLVGQLAQRPELSGIIAIDTLRIDRLGPDGEPEETQEIVAPDERDWPISLGVVANGVVRFRLRAFRGENARASEEGPLVPLRNLSLDRLVDVAPGSAFERRLVLLDAECFNAPAEFVGNWSSCLDRKQPSVAPGEGIDSIDGPPATRVGTSPLSEPQPCGEPPSASVVCIPGGVGRLGDETSSLLASEVAELSSPSRIVQHAPFFLDRTEVTVGRYRRLAQSGALDAAEPGIRNTDVPFRESCTYLGLSDATNDDLPLNCMTFETARALCRADGGDLPSESQWEYAARGRDYARLYPWGSSFPECCTASVERSDPIGASVDCEGDGIEPVGSHADPAACATRDVTRDGVFDMAGSLREWTSDPYRPYDHACWATRGVPLDPRCADDATAHAVRGSYYNASFATLLVVKRGAGSPGGVVGIRCAYPAGVQR